LQDGFTKLDPNDSEAEAEYYKDFLAPPSSQDEGSEKAEEDIEAYRNKLLSGIDLGKADNNKTKEGKKQLDFDNIDWDNINEDDLDSDDLDAMEQHQNNGGKSSNKQRKGNNDGPDIKFTTGFGEDIGKKLLK
jgi:hypothetical protein